ncbi:hypothetical protein KJ785_01200 [Patescibacteria group bacterium]|nr:hypothetical protein [Patescibacteria group bacterium]
MVEEYSRASYDGAEQQKKETLDRHRSLGEEGIRGLRDLITYIKSGVDCARAEKALKKIALQGEKEAGELRMEHDKLKEQAVVALEKLQKFENEKLGI